MRALIIVLILFFLGRRCAKDVEGIYGIAGIVLVIIVLIIAEIFGRVTGVLE